MKFAFIADMAAENEHKPRKERFPAAFMCEMLEVSRGGYYAWVKRPPSGRDLEGGELTRVIKQVHDENEGKYGIDRIHGEMAKRGYRVGLRRVRRVAGLSCVHPKPYKVTTVQDEANGDGLVDLVGREFVPDAENELWYGDITYIYTMSGWAYLATVIDGYSRRVVDWAIAGHMRESLVIDALKMAIANRRPEQSQMVFHSDRGSQYTGRKFRALCLDSGYYPVGGGN